MCSLGLLIQSSTVALQTEPWWRCPRVKVELDVEAEYQERIPLGREQPSPPPGPFLGPLFMLPMQSPLPPQFPPPPLSLFLNLSLSVFWNSTVFSSSVRSHFTLYWFNSVLICCPPQPHICFLFLSWPPGLPLLQVEPLVTQAWILTSPSF